MKKVFSIGKYIENLLKINNGVNLIDSLNNGWPQECEGKDITTVPYAINNDWCIDVDDTTTTTSTDRKKAKLQYHLVPPEQLKGIAEIMQKGEETHDEPYMNIDPVLYFDAAFRHLMAIRNGEVNDQEDHMSHALHLACNGMILDRQLKAGKVLDFGKEEN